ncbi:MAG: NAD(P) transhydrogenase subunit alpha [Pirellulaceae bacterium]|nr:NAD(P) transhydrogenase subunit alpha [Pirellulaceae bacterium]
MKAILGTIAWFLAPTIVLFLVGVQTLSVMAKSDRSQSVASSAADDTDANPADLKSPAESNGTSHPDQQISTGQVPNQTRQNTFLIASLTVFILAIFIGFEVITKVPPTLHTPLMSGSNAISGITIVGAIVVTSNADDWKLFLGMLAVILATINVVGGFLVTHRMLAMFKRK